MANDRAALLALAKTIALDLASKRKYGIATLLVRPTPQPVLAIIGCLDATLEAELAAQAQELNHACASLRYIDYAQAEQDCERLAAKLAERFGRIDLDRFHFVAIPRGGHIVLGILAYILGLQRMHLEPPYPPDIPLVVVDDCALTGARLGRFLEHYENHQIIFAHLYSQPNLRKAIKAQEPRVIACLGAWDLHDHSVGRLGEKHTAWQERWFSRLDGRRYWIGQPDHVCFAWNEPDRFTWNPIIQRMESAWHIIPPELCLKNRPDPSIDPIPVQVQPEGKGPLRPSRQVIFAELEERIVICNLETGDSFSLADVAADMWRAIINYGNMKNAAAALLSDYDVDEGILRVDLRDFVNDLLAQHLLEQS